MSRADFFNTVLARTRPQTRTFPRRAFEISSLLVLLVVVALIYVLLGRTVTQTYAADLSQPDAATSLTLTGFYGPEQSDGAGYRWSQGTATVQLPLRYATNARYTATIQLRAPNPAGPQPLTFFASQRDIITVTPSNDFRIYHLMLPADTGSVANPRFGLRTASFEPTADQRELGVAVSDVVVAQVPHIHWLTVFFVPLALGVLWGISRWRGSAWGGTALVVAVVAVALLTLYARYTAAPLNYLWLAGSTLAACGIAVALARQTAARLALFALVVLVGFSGMLWPSWFSDDAFISFRYAENLVAGHGLVYNVGERVEGYTNFLWTMLAALVIALGGDPVFWAYVAGVVLALAIVLLTFWFAQRLLGAAWALVAALAVATSQSLFVYTSRGAGLETGLFTLLALLGSALFLNRRTRLWSGLVFALATLTRPEGVLLMGLTAAFALIEAKEQGQGIGDREQGTGASAYPEPVERHANAARSTQHLLANLRSLVPTLALYLLIIGPFFAWRFWYYGDLLPNTFYAKTGGGASQLLRGLRYAGEFALAMGGPLLLVIAAPLAARERWTRLRSWWGYLLLLVSAYTGYIIAVGGDHFPGERFFVPLVPWFALLIAHGLADIYRWARLRLRPAPLAPLLLAVLLVGFSWGSLTRSAAFDRTLVGNDESVWIWRDIGLWLHDNTPPDASVAALGAGAIAYYSDRTTIDMLGLNDKHIARLDVADMGVGVAGHEKRDPNYVLNVRRPTYIPKLWDGYFAGMPELQQDYRLISVTTRSGRQIELWERLP